MLNDLEITEIEQWISLHFNSVFLTKTHVDIRKLIHYRSYYHIAVWDNTETFHTNTYPKAIIKHTKPKASISKTAKGGKKWFSIYADIHKINTCNI